MCEVRECHGFAAYSQDMSSSIQLTPGAGQFAEAKDARCVFQEMR